MKIRLLTIMLGMVLLFSCHPPKPETKTLAVKHNYIILLDLSDRLIIQDNQPSRDTEIIQNIYKMFKEKVKNEFYIKSRDEIKVVIAPQKGDNLRTELFEDKLYFNMENIPHHLKRKNEPLRTEQFNAYLDTLYQKARFSETPTDYNGADIWKYVYEDLKTDYITDTLTKNFLFILTDGYPIVGKNKQKLEPVLNRFPGLHVVLVEAAPREKDMEWDSIMNMWSEWFKEIGVEDYTLIKRKAISKEIEEIKDIISAS
ncbi:MAG: hypothetical protein JXA77_05015 [Bacteroidales bacterium]|nr:hypothetical protein [Bacteroidales bacterium]MBN2820408.1 hypothetical protein [Bacteroidales bacterium]